jgi:hypothetical protein
MRPACAAHRVDLAPYDNSRVTWRSLKRTG